MKVNKKLIVPFLAAVIGLSVSGSIGGAFAWYQYNSQVTASFIGSSVADTSVLQIGYMGSNDIVWGRDYVEPNSVGNAHSPLIPVTFGELTAEGALPVSKPYGYPEAGKQGYVNWATIENGEGFSQFDVYLKATKADGSLYELDVYLSEVVIEGAGEDSTDPTSKLVSDAVRIHLDVENGSKFLISKNKVEDLDLFGELDLDGDGKLDKQGGYAWQQAVSNNTIVYGTSGQHQNTKGISDIVNGRGSDGLIPTDNAKRICKTLTEDIHGNPQYIKITVTVWLEGWELLKNKVDTSSQTPVTKTSLWNPTYSAGLDVRVGMTFDTGKIRIP